MIRKWFSRWFGGEYKAVATLTVTSVYTCPHDLDETRFERTVVLRENDHGRRLIRDLPATLLAEEVPDITHWLVGGALPGKARPIKEAA